MTSTNSHASHPAACPIQVGDEVTGHDRRWRGQVRRTHFDTDIPRCVVETSDGRTGSMPPWALIPADEEPSQQWLDRMQTYRDTARDRVTEALHHQQCEIAHYAADLARELGAMAAALRDGDFPDTREPVEFNARDLDSALTDLTELRAEAAAAGLLSAPDARLRPVTPAAVSPASSASTSQTTTPRRTNDGHHLKGEKTP